MPARQATTLLQDNERAVLARLLQQEAKHPENPRRPILVLTPTDPWLPPDESPERPPDVSAERWRELWEVPGSLRSANVRPFDLTGLELPPGVALYPRLEFEREYESDGSFRRLVDRLGGVEPLVLKVSRPSLEDGRAFVLLHVLSTWSGCGGVNEYVVDERADPQVELRRVLVVW